MADFNLGDKPPSKPSSTTPEKPKRKTLTLSIKPDQQSPPENQMPDLTPPNGGSVNAAPLPDFDNAPLPDDENLTPAVQVGEGAAPHVTASGIMTYEAFDQMFCAAFSLSGHITGFKTLVEAPERPSRPDATKAMYEIILDTPAFRFILNPQSLWMQRTLAMGAFFVPVVVGVAGEMRAKAAGPSIQEGSIDAPAANPAKSMRDSLKGR